MVAAAITTEGVLHDIYRDVLRLEKLDSTTNILELGADSLPLLRLCRSIGERLCVEVSVGDLLRAPTIRAIGEIIDQRLSGERHPVSSLAASPISDLATSRHDLNSEAAQEHIVPASFAQERMWLIEEIEDGGTAYIITGAFRCATSIDTCVLRRAFEEIVARHEILRTKFKKLDGRIVQVISEQVAVHWEERDLTALSDEQVRRRRLDQLLNQQGAIPFRLTHSPLIRCHLIHLDPANHYLQLVIHHAIFDGRSFGLLLDEWRTVYRELIEAGGPRAIAARAQYRDFCNLQRRRLQGPTLDRLKRYWATQLDGLGEPLKLPQDKAAEPTAPGPAERISLLLPAGLANKLKAVGSQSGTTLFMVLLAAFDVLLLRHTGQTDIAVATPVSERHDGRFDDVIGLFVNTLILRVQLDRGMCFRDLLGVVRDVVASAFMHQALPFDQVVKLLNPVRSVGQSPFTTVMFALQNFEMPSFDHGFLTPHHLLSVPRTAKYDLTLEISQTTGGMHCAAEFATARLERVSIERLLANWQVLLENLVSDPETRIGSVPVISEDQRQLLMEGWNATERQAHGNGCIQHYFEQKVLNRKEQVAVRDGHVSVSYGELNERSNRLAFHLISRGIRRNERIAVCMPRSAELITILLGVLKSGGCYVPIDPKYPADRVRYIVEDSHAALVIATDDVWKTAGEQIHVPYLRVDQFFSRAEKGRSDNPSIGAQPDDCAYVIYTSGSTGRPKGVMVSHRSVVNVLQWLSVTCPLRPGDAYLLKTNYVFDVSVSELFGWMFGEGAVVVLDQDTIDSPDELLKCILQQGLTHINFVPTLLRLFLAAAGRYPRFAELSRLKFIMVAGEALPKALAMEAAQYFAPAAVFNLYGPTETTVYSTAFKCGPSIDQSTTPIGTPIWNTKVLVFDEELQLVPIGCPGELFIAGSGVAGGYLNAPELTRERFISARFENIGPLYKTGDRVRWTSGGLLEFLGRADFQVKLRGMRIGLEEIEEYVRETGLVSQCVVVCQAPPKKGARLVCFFSPKEGQSVEPPAEELHGLTREDEYAGRVEAILRCKLPEHMVPSTFVRVDRIPVTSAGKVDRQALSSMRISEKRRGEGYTSPKDSTETELCGIWSAVLGLERVGIRDNFFSLGGDSILAMEVVARANALGISLSTRDLFEHQTIETLARVARDARPTSDQSDCVGCMELSPIQLQFLSRDTRFRNQFYQSRVLTTPAGTDVEFVTALVQALYRRHDVLRLRFLCDGTKWSAFFSNVDSAVVDQTLSVHQAASSSAVHIGEVLTAHESVARGAIDIERGPLFKVLAVSIPTGLIVRLLLIFHHLVIDRVSWRVLMDDFELAFEQWQKEKQIQLRPKTSSFAEWAAMLHSYSHTAEIEAERGYWLRALLESTPVVPTKQWTPVDNREGTTRTRSISWDAATTRKLLAECQHAYRTKINELLLASLLIAFHRWCNTRSLPVAVEGHGRETHFPAQALTAPVLDASETVGWFTTYFPINLSCDSLGTARAKEAVLRDVITSVKEQCRAVPGGGLGYGILRYLRSDEELAAAARTSSQPIVFNYLGRLDQVEARNRRFRTTGESVGRDIGLSREREHLFGFNGAVTNGELSFVIDYCGGQFESDGIGRFAAEWGSSLREIVDHCYLQRHVSLSPSDFPLARLTAEDVEHWQRTYPTLEDIYPATPMQLGMIFHSKLRGDESAYTNQIIVQFQGGLDANLFEVAWAQVIDRHGVLRAAITALDLEQALQIVVAGVRPRWRNVDLQDMDAGQRIHEIQRITWTERNLPFDFSQASLMRFTMIAGREPSFTFVWTYHHCILDGWSVALLWKELLNSYHSLSGCDPVPAETVLPYSNYVRWLYSQNLARAEDYWRMELSHVCRPTSISTSASSSSPTNDRGCVFTIELQPEVSDRLRAFARFNEVTIATAVYAAWALLLAEYSHADEVVFGVTVSGRAIDLQKAESIVGAMICTLPCRVNVRHKESLGEWLRRLQKEQVTREANGYLPLASIQRCSGIGRANALFDTVVIVENYPFGGPRQPHGATMAQWSSQERTHYGVTLLVLPAGESISMEIAFKEGLFTRDDMISTARKLETILHRLSTGNTFCDGAPPGPLSSTGFATGPSDEHPGCAVSKCCRQGVLRLGRYLVSELVENNAREFPDIAAIVHNGKELSYQQLNAAANGVARQLLDRLHDPTTDDVIALAMPRDKMLLVTILAIWKIGAAYLPVDPKLPAARINSMLAGANARGLITGPAISVPLASTLSTKIVPSQALSFESMPEADLENTVSGNDLAYVIYTSGSTGTPKGAMVEQIGMLNNIKNKIIDLQINRASRIACTASPSFDISVWQMFAALSAGGTTVIYDDRVINDIGGLLRSLDRDAVTIVEMVPSYLALVLEYLISHPAVTLPQLEFLVLTGEAAEASAIEAWFERFPHIKVMNAYGPTEASDDITHHILTAGDSISNPVPVGTALANFDIYIVDEKLRPVPVGTLGEIVVTGVGVGRGYVNSPEGTNEKFLSSPFPDKYKRRLYRTGDLGVLRQDGVLIFRGRADRQVKIRGFRIELEEIELALLGVGGIRHAAALAMESPGGEARICAFVVAEAQVGRQAIIYELGKTLPAYMIPSEFQLLDTMPLLASGKVDRSRLKEMFGGIKLALRSERPANVVEDRLAQVWAEVLKVADVGVTDDFFDLGGDSFKAIRIAAKYGPPLEVVDIVNLKTIRTIADDLRAREASVTRRIIPLRRQSSAAAAVIGIPNSGGDPVSFASVASELDGLNSELTLYAVKLPRTPVNDEASLADEIERLTAEICDAVVAEVVCPVILFGQCNGSALALQVARELERRAVSLRAVCIGGALMRCTPTPVDSRLDHEILNFLSTIGASIPEQSDERFFFLDDFRYDCRLANCFYNRVQDSAALSENRIVAPIYCMVGSNDPLVPGYKERFTDWLRMSSSASLIEFENHGHFLLRDCARQIAYALTSVWQQVQEE